MLFILIPIVWLAVVALCVAVCLMAQRGDAEYRASADTRPASAGRRPVAPEKLPELTLGDGGFTLHGRLTTRGAR
ncbi:MAG TPA: hypothetical protein VNY27_02395 [Solirubrobacteraceae bacterium]|jgi:hypothetical protein|nr:hypothetical protein [Solirubrobacteraceae bacterium]